MNAGAEADDAQKSLEDMRGGLLLTMKAVTKRDTQEAKPLPDCERSFGSSVQSGAVEMTGSSRRAEGEENKNAKNDPSFDLVPELPDDTLLEWIRIPTGIRNALEYAGLKTIGEVRQMTDQAFNSVPNFGSGSLKWLRARSGWHKTTGPNKITWGKVGKLTEPGRYLHHFGWLNITPDDLSVWEQFPEAAFTLLKVPSNNSQNEYRLGVFDIRP